ncbi:21365_t:CDS:2, partial [Gigaspora margarita]
MEKGTEKLRLPSRRHRSVQGEGQFHIEETSIQLYDSRATSTPISRKKMVTKKDTRFFVMIPFWG